MSRADRNLRPSASGRRGRQTIDKTATLPPLNFTAAEMVAIAVSLAREEGTPFAAATRSALRKVIAVASAAQTAQAADLMERIGLIGTMRPSRGGQGLLGRKTTDGAVRVAAANPESGQAEVTVPLAIQEAIITRARPYARIPRSARCRDRPRG